MEFFTLRFSSYGLLLLCTFWSVADCSTTAPSLKTTDVSPSVSTATTPPTTTSPLPEDVEIVTVVGRTENSVTIEFDQVVNISRYELVYDADIQGNITIQGGENNTIRHTLVNLTSAQNYSMTLYSVADDGRKSPGRLFYAVTAPENVDSFTVYNQTTSSITLQWTKKLNVAHYILEFDEDNRTFTADDPAVYEVPNLNSSTYYVFTLYSVFEGIKSTGAKRTAATAPLKAEGFERVEENDTSITLQWKNDVKDISYILEYDNKPQTFNASDLGNPAKFTATDLQSATYYTFSLRTVFASISGEEAILKTPTAPQNAERFNAVDQNETSITLQWDPVLNVTDYILNYIDGHINISGRHYVTITDLTSATWYNFTLIAVFGIARSSGSRLTAATNPLNTEEARSVNRNETSITLRWKPAPNVTHYIVEYSRGKINVTDGYQETITDLSSGTSYDFTIISVFATFTSRGYHLTAATVPSQVSSVTVTKRDLTSITLQWTSPRDTWKYLVVINGKTETVEPTGESASHTASNLNEGTQYTYSITTEFEGLRSATYEKSTVTTIDCTKVDWKVTETSIEGRVAGEFTTATASNGSSHDSSGSKPEVKFTGLYPGATYALKLMYNELDQCTHSLTIIPPALEARCKDWNAGYSIYIEWNSPSGIWDSVEVNVSGQQYIAGTNGEHHVELSNFQPAKKYQVSICSQSMTRKSRAYDFTCATDARGVIAGSFFGVLLFLILVGVVAFIVLRRPDLIRRKKPGMGGARTSLGRSKAIPLEKFPAHFNELSADENKGFSIEYEDLALVGTTQSQKAATTPENKPKNRFVNVLPYDRSRVKMTSSSPHSDYINASYMPGYNSDREFIASQGPMPSTVSDFWRMIWEQKVKGIIMVTNCTEGGRTKCEQYWPDSGPRVCGDLAVFTTSQQKETDWMLREFTVKNRRTSEERTVKHFHFTAWPDHGVPQGTEVLIQFRALVRKHIQREAAGAPTVVHCSAGVGRTGTIIALDTLLQQMEKENVVDINGFVYKMRLNRPHMVQTESQYVFLHQCVLDSLRPNATRQEEENIYENDIIYANATALREYQDSLNKA